METSQTYTINEAAALTGLHRNTIRQRIRLGQLKATVHQGKFGDEYRITPAALVQAGLLPEAGPLGDTAANDAVLEAEFAPETTPHAAEPPEAPPEGNGALAANTLAALGELYQRHEQAMFRLGYMQNELDRVKALAETAESLQKDGAAREQELHALQAALRDKERQAAEAEALRRELEQTRERLREVETLRQDIDRLKAVAAEQETLINSLDAAGRRPWWRFWGD